MTRTIQVNSPAMPRLLGSPALELKSLQGSEGLGQLFRYVVELQTPDSPALSEYVTANVPIKELVGKEFGIRIELDGKGSLVAGMVDGGAVNIGAGAREINGLVTSARFVQSQDRRGIYEVVIEPWLVLATRTSDYKIFQQKSPLQIIQEVLADYSFLTENRTSHRYPERVFQVQYGETDFEFISRLMQEWGIYYFFEHGGGVHKLILVDDVGAHKPFDSAAYQTISYYPPGHKIDEEYCSEFHSIESLQSGQWVTDDFDFTKPRARLRQTSAMPRRTGNNTQELYKWPGDYVEPDEGTTLARIRMEEAGAAGSRAGGSGNLRAIVPGCTFALVKYPQDKANRDYLVIAATLALRESAHASGQGGYQCHTRFQLQPARDIYRSPQTQPKPHTTGPQTAIVTGPAGQNIWTDEYGRVKVSFHWNRYCTKDQDSSCWIRVSSSWAGGQLGGVHTPRIGQEVIVDFENGDPDKPLITGRVYNALNMPPWELSSQSALSGLRSRELTQEGGNSAAGRSNHLILDDTAEKIQAQLKSDHQHSQLSLGHITRIEDNAGRKDPRGEGFELRSDGHGAVRAGKGLLLSTDGRSQAVGGLLSRDELVSCLKQALALAEDLGKAAADSQGAARETGPQQDLSQAVDALGHGASDERDAKGKAAGGQPVLAISGAAGIASATPKDHTQYAGQNIDTVASRNQQHYAGRSILHSASKDIEQFAVQGDIRAIANQGKLIQQAQHNSVEITANKSLTLTSTEEDVIVRAKNSITLMLDDGTYLRLAAGKIVLGMKSEFIVKSSGRVFTGPSTLSVELPHFGKTGFNDSFVVMDQAGEPVPGMRYRLTRMDGGVVEGVTGADAKIPLQKGLGPDNVKLELLGLQS